MVYFCVDIPFTFYEMKIYTFNVICTSMKLSSLNESAPVEIGAQIEEQRRRLYDVFARRHTPIP